MTVLEFLSGGQNWGEKGRFDRCLKQRYRTEEKKYSLNMTFYAKLYIYQLAHVKT